MNFPTTTEEFLKTLANGKEPTSEDREYAEALGKLSELNYRAGYKAGAAKNKGQNLMSALVNTISSVFLIDIQIFCSYTYCKAKRKGVNVYE